MVATKWVARVPSFPFPSFPSQIWIKTSFLSDTVREWNLDCQSEDAHLPVPRFMLHLFYDVPLLCLRATFSPQWCKASGQSSLSPSSSFKICMILMLEQLKLRDRRTCLSTSSTTPSVTDERRPQKQLVADVELDSGSSAVHTAEVCPISKGGGTGLAGFSKFNHRMFWSEDLVMRKTVCAIACSKCSLRLNPFSFHNSHEAITAIIPIL